MTLPPKWAERPIEEAGLFNPAFTALAISRTVAAFTKQTGRGLPYPLAFLILPTVLHAETRAALPATTNAVMQTWLETNAPMLSTLPGRVKRLLPVSKEAILFGVLHAKLTIEDASLAPGRHRFAANAEPPEATAETRDCLRAASFLGRWFVVAGTPTTVLASWGVAP